MARAFFIVGVVTIFCKSLSLGIDICSSDIKLILGRQEKEKFRLLHFVTLPMTSMSNTSAHSYRTEHEEKLAALIYTWKIKRQPAVLAVHGPDLYLETFSFPHLARRKLRASAILQATAGLTYTSDQLACDVMILPSPQDPDQCKVIFMAAKKNHVLNLAELISRAGLKPAVVEFSLLALQRVAGELPPGSALGYIRSEICSIGIFRGAELKQQFFWSESDQNWRMSGNKRDLLTAVGQDLKGLGNRVQEAVNRLYLAASDKTLGIWREALKTWDVEVLPITLPEEILLEAEEGNLDPDYYIALGLALRGSK